MRRLFLFVLPLFLVGCYDQKIAQLEKEMKELHAALDKQKQIVDLDTQTKCSNAAKAFFSNHMHLDKTTIMIDYSNHYNQQAGRCYVIIEEHDKDELSKTGEWFKAVKLYDALENDKLGELSSHTDINATNFQSSERVLTCFVLDDKCTTSAEFTTKVVSYMNN